MFAQAVEVAVVGQDERVSLQLLPHQYVRAFTLDNLYRFFKTCGQGFNFDLTAPGRSVPHLFAVIRIFCRSQHITSTSV